MAETVTVNPRGFAGFDDAERNAGQNGKPALADQFRKCIAALNAIQSSGRMLATSWGREGSQVNNDNLFRTLWNHHHVPGRKLRGVALILKTAGTRAVGQGLRGTVSATATDYKYDYQASASGVDPTSVQAFNFFTGIDDAGTGHVVSCNVGSITANGPGIRGLMLYEGARETADPSVENFMCPDEHCAPGRDIVAATVGSGYNQTKTIRSVFLHAWNRKRPTIAWSHNTPGTGWIGQSTSAQAFRNIFDQTQGDGGAACASTSTAITFPGRYAGSGLNTSISACLYLYAAMSGATDAGSVAISHSDGAGGMTALTSVSGINITGTTFAWYPATGANAATFKIRTDIPYDRIVVAVKSNGATDYVRVGAFVIFPRNSTAIP